jgi:hypothetical protein
MVNPNSTPNLRNPIEPVASIMQFFQERNYRIIGETTVLSCIFTMKLFIQLEQAVWGLEHKKTCNWELLLLIWNTVCSLKFLVNWSMVAA